MTNDELLTIVRDHIDSEVEVCHKGLKAKCKLAVQRMGHAFSERQTALDTIAPLKAQNRQKQVSLDVANAEIRKLTAQLQEQKVMFRAELKAQGEKLQRLTKKMPVGFGGAE